jgi:hypothetical protein
MEFLKKLLSEPDNTTPCIIRVGAAISFLYSHALMSWGVIVHATPFDFQQYALGLSAFVAAVGAALGMKKDTK